MTVVAPKPRMTVDAFLPWAMAQPSGRYELVNGEVVAMAPERAIHAETKAEAWLALRTALAAAGLPCRAYVDGLGVRIDEATLYEPDVLVRCGTPLADDALEAPDPMIVVEVVSPSSAARDSGAKLEDYFSLPSVAHYLILKTDSRAAIHHRRAGDAIATTILRDGAVTLDPPGVTLDVAALFPVR